VKPKSGPLGKGLLAPPASFAPLSMTCRPLHCLRSRHDAGSGCSGRPKPQAGKDGRRNRAPARRM